MDKLTVFPTGLSEITLSEEETTISSYDTLTKVLNEIREELRLTRAGHETWTWGNLVEDSEEIDIEELEVQQ